MSKPQRPLTVRQFIKKISVLISILLLCPIGLAFPQATTSSTVAASSITGIITNLLLDECHIKTEPPLPKCFPGVIETQEHANLFKNVKVVKGHLQIEAKEDIDLSAFDKLREIHGILYLHNGQLTSINGFNNLESVATRAASNGNGHQIYIDNNPNLTTISGFQKLKKSTHPESGSPAIFIRSNNSLSQISGFTSLDQAAVISIRFNPGLRTINGFDSLHTIDSGGGLNISNSTDLTRIPSFSKLSIINGWFDLYDLPNLNSIPRFGALTYARTLRIQNLGISEMGSFKNNGFITTHSISINANRNLTLISGFTNLRSIEGERGDIYINDNPLLNNVTGFNRLITNDPTDYISVAENPALDCPSELFMLEPVAYSQRNLVNCATTPYNYY